MKSEVMDRSDVTWTSLNICLSVSTIRQLDADMRCEFCIHTQFRHMDPLVFITFEDAHIDA